MSAIIQFDLFQPKPSEADYMRADIEAVRESSTKVRKALFARNNELQKRMLELETRLEILERGLCQKK